MSDVMIMNKSSNTESEPYEDSGGEFVISGSESEEGTISGNLQHQRKKLKRRNDSGAVRYCYC